MLKLLKFEAIKCPEIHRFFLTVLEILEKLQKIFITIILDE